MNAMEIYTLPSFIHRYKNVGWVPILGSTLRVQRELVCYDELFVGLIPNRFVDVFKKFLQHGQISAQCTGAIWERIDAADGYFIPVDYIFHGGREIIHRVISELGDMNLSAQMKSLESSPRELRTDMNNDTLKHTLLRIQPNEYKPYPTRRCVDCKMRGIRKETRLYCNGCPDKTALCRNCFNTLHFSNSHCA